jgi:hypothetical protein
VRRVGTLVARGAEPSEVGGAVAEELRQALGAITAGIWRFEASGEITLVAAAADPAALAKWPLGTRTPIEGNTLATVVQRTGLPARIDSYENIAGGSPHGCARWACARRWEFRSSSTAVCGAWRPQVPRNLAPCRPTQKRASAGSPNSSPLPWWRVTATSRKGSSWARHPSVRF